MQNDFTKSSSEKRNETPAKVYIVHDSVLKRIHEGKLGNGYGCDVSKEVAYTLDDAEHSLKQINNLEKNTKPEAVVVHVGTNDLKRSDEKKSAQKCVQIITKFAKENPDIKVIYSKVTPTKKVEINKKRHIFNTQVTTGICDSGLKNVFAINHEYLRSYDLYDDVHPNIRGDRKLAVHIGRVLWGMFWTASTRRRQKQQEAWWAENVIHY